MSLRGGHIGISLTSCDAGDSEASNSITCVRRYQRENCAMPSVRINDIPEDRRADQPLQEYLRSRLIADANQPTLAATFPSRPPSNTFGQNVIVVDASVLAVALGDDGVDGRHARERLADETLIAPELVDLEVVSVSVSYTHLTLPTKA